MFSRYKCLMPAMMCVTERAAAPQPVPAHCSGWLRVLLSPVATNIGATVAAMVAPPHLPAVSQDSELRICCSRHADIHVCTQQDPSSGRNFSFINN